jgi:hypothetical protein
MSNEQEMREVAEKILRDTDKLGVIKPGTVGWIVAVSAVQAATLAAEARIRDVCMKVAMEVNAANRMNVTRRLDEIVDAALTEHKENQG